jgi:protein CpxP
MKSFRFRLLIAATAVLLGSAIAKSQTAADAPPPPPMHHHGMHGHMMRAGFFPRALNITDEQKTQMKAIMEKERPTMTPLFQQERQIDQQLHQFSEGAYDETKVRTLAAQKSQLEVELTVAHTRVHNEMYQLLTTDQRAQLKEIEANRQARMQEHMHEAPPAPEQ